MSRINPQNNTSMKIYYNDFLTYILFIMFFFLIPSVKRYMSVARELELVFVAVSFCVAFYLMYTTNVKLRSNLWSLSLYIIYILIRTYMCDGIISNFIADMLTVYVLCMAFYMNKDWERDGTITKWIVFLTILVFIDFVCELAFPNGMYNNGYEANWFLGYKTNRMLYSFPLLLFINLRYIHQKKIRCSYYFLTFLVLVSMYLSNGTAGFFSMLLFEIVSVLILQHYHRYNRLPAFSAFLYHPLFYLGVVLFFYFFVVMGRSTGVLEVITSVFSEKSITLSGRTNIWERAFAWLGDKKLIWGGGYLSGSEYIEILNFKNPHNQVLSYVMSGGVVGCIVLFLFGFFSLRKMRRSPENSILLMAIYTIFLLGVISSTFAFSPFLFLFFFLISINQEKVAFSRREKRKKKHMKVGKAV